MVPMVETSNRQLKNICVISGFCYEKYKEFVQVAVDLGHVIIERKLHRTYGGESQLFDIIPKALKTLGCSSAHQLKNN
ncbi:hypothetical protein CUMW_198700 [Citrus unshiu]|nr:hypothetical protein CUMW_198700 [Citrus unshiu]